MVHERMMPPKGQLIRAGVRPMEADAFVLKQLRDKGLDFAAEADKLTLLRRVYFDLSGLPPTPAEAEQFLRDNDPLAYERLVDRLLDSPRYGERA
jgi:hypothetical protein